MEKQQGKPQGVVTVTGEKVKYDQAELLTIGEVAARLKLKVSFFYAPVRREGPDAIPCLKVGKYIRYRLPDVMDWINKQNEARG